MIRVTILDIQASMKAGEAVPVGPALVYEYNIGTARPIVSMMQEDGSNDNYLIPGSLLTFMNGHDKVMYVAESVDEIEEAITACTVLYSLETDGTDPSPE